MYEIIDGWFVFMDRLDKPFDNTIIPSNIHKVRFVWRTDAYIVDRLPNHITHLEFPYVRCKQNIGNILPKNLTYLRFGKISDLCGVTLSPSIVTLRIVSPTKSNILLYYIHNYDTYHKYQTRCEINKHNLNKRQTSLFDILL